MIGEIHPTVQKSNFTLPRVANLVHCIYTQIG
jgi:hypothetical protein